MSEKLPTQSASAESADNNQTPLEAMLEQKMQEKRLSDWTDTDSMESMKDMQSYLERSPAEEQSETETNPLEKGIFESDVFFDAENEVVYAIEAQGEFNGAPVYTVSESYKNGAEKKSIVSAEEAMKMVTGKELIQRDDNQVAVLESISTAGDATRAVSENVTPAETEASGNKYQSQFGESVNEAMENVDAEEAEPTPEAVEEAESTSETAEQAEPTRETTEDLAEQARDAAEEASQNVDNEDADRTVTPPAPRPPITPEATTTTAEADDDTSEEDAPQRTSRTRKLGTSVAKRFVRLKNRPRAMRVAKGAFEKKVTTRAEELMADRTAQFGVQDAEYENIEPRMPRAMKDARKELKKEQKANRPEGFGSAISRTFKEGLRGKSTKENDSRDEESTPETQTIPVTGESEDTPVVVSGRQESSDGTPFYRTRNYDPTAWAQAREQKEKEEQE